MFAPMRTSAAVTRLTIPGLSGHANFTVYEEGIISGFQAEFGPPQYDVCGNVRTGSEFGSRTCKVRCGAAQRPDTNDCFRV